MSGPAHKWTNLTVRYRPGDEALAALNRRRPRRSWRTFAARWLPRIHWR